MSSAATPKRRESLAIASAASKPRETKRANLMAAMLAAAPTATPPTSLSPKFRPRVACGTGTARNLPSSEPAAKSTCLSACTAPLGSPRNRNRMTLHRPPRCP